MFTANYEASTYRNALQRIIWRIYRNKISLLVSTWRINFKLRDISRRAAICTRVHFLIAQRLSARRLTISSCKRGRKTDKTPFPWLLCVDRFTRQIRTSRTLKCQANFTAHWPTSCSFHRLYTADENEERKENERSWSSTCTWQSDVGGKETKGWID